MENIERLQLAARNDLNELEERLKYEKYGIMSNATRPVELRIAANTTFDMIYNGIINTYISLGGHVGGTYQTNGADLIAKGDITYLMCEANGITALDVSRLTALTVLLCVDNQLQTLDVSKLAELIFLECMDNQLMELNLAKHTKLTRLDCSNNRLATLPMSGLTALTRLSCDNNRLTTLDLLRNVNLTELYCSDNPNLNVLHLPEFSSPINDSSGFAVLYIDGTPIAANPTYIIDNIIPKLPTRNSANKGTITVSNITTKNAIQPYLTSKFWTAA